MFELPQNFDEKAIPKKSKIYFLFSIFAAPMKIK